MLTRRGFLRLSGTSTLGFYVATQFGWVRKAMAEIPGGTLDPTALAKFGTSMLIPPAMPRSGRLTSKAAKSIDYYANQDG